MRIFIREILPAGLPGRQAGLEIERDLTMEELGLDADHIELSAPLQVRASIKRVGDTVLAHVRFQSRFPFACARCLEKSEKTLSGKADFDYAIDPTTEFVDVGEDIRQEVILNVTQRALCSEDCKGLCPECGANLNKEPCKCEVSQKSGRKK